MSEKKIESIFKKTHPKSIIELLTPDTMRCNDIVLRHINSNNDTIILLQFATFNDYIIVEYVLENDWDEKLSIRQSNSTVVNKSHPNSYITIIDVNSSEYKKVFDTPFFPRIGGLHVVILQATHSDNHAIIEFMEKDTYEYLLKNGKTTIN